MVILSFLILTDTTLGQTLSSFIIYNSISSWNFWGFFCLFWGLSSHSRIVLSYEDVTTAGKVLQILTYARHSWSLSSEGSLACHNYCDTGHPFIMVISGDLWHSHSGTDPTWFYDLGLSWLGFENPTNKACEVNALIHRAIAAVCPIFKDNDFFISYTLYHFVSESMDMTACIN